MSAINKGYGLSSHYFFGLLLATAIIAALLTNVAIAVLLLLFWLIYSMPEKKVNMDSWARNGNGSMLLWAIWLTYAQFNSGIGSIGWFTTWIFLAMPLGYMASQYNLIVKEQIWVHFQDLIGFVGVVLAIWGIYQVVGLGYQRAIGPLADPNVFGCLLNLVWFPLFARFMATKDIRKSVLWGAGLFFIHLGLTMTGSRAAIFIWLLLTGASIAIFWKLYSKNKLLLLISTVAVNYLIYSLYSNHLGSDAYAVAFDVYQSSRPSDSPRLLMWQATLKMWLDHPLLGTGFGSWNYLYPQYRLLAETGTSGYYVHNDYLQILEEGGLVTLLFFTAVIGQRYYQGIKTALRALNVTDRSEKFGLIAAIAAALLHAFVNFTFYLIYINLLIGIYLARLNQFGNNSASEPTTKNYNKKWVSITFVGIIAVNGVNAVLTVFGTATLTDRAFVARYVPHLNFYPVAVALSILRPSDTLAQQYVTSSIGNVLLHGSPALDSEQKQELLNEVLDDYTMLHHSNRYDAEVLKNEAHFLLDYDLQNGFQLTHIERINQLLQEAMKMNPFDPDNVLLMGRVLSFNGRSREAIDLWVDALSRPWWEKDRMQIEAEILKNKFPERSAELSQLQNELHSIRLHCSVKECQHYKELQRSARTRLNEFYQ